MRELQRTIELLASSDASAIITGKSGTGKEVVARAVHALSSRRDKPFIAINADAIPECPLDRAIFGHAPGAFTGATRARPGLFHRGHRGPLSLDYTPKRPRPLPPPPPPS